MQEVMMNTDVPLNALKHSPERIELQMVETSALLKQIDESWHEFLRHNGMKLLVLQHNTH
jgi:hypothetical protein